MGVFNLDSRITPLFPFTTNRDDLLRAASNAFYGTSVDITRAAEAVLNSTPNTQLYVGFKAGNTGGYNDLSTTGSVSIDRKSTRLNSSHLGISYAVFCLK